MKELIAKVWPSVVITNVCFWAFILLMSVSVTGCGDRTMIPENKSRFFVEDSLTFAANKPTLCDTEKALCYSSKKEMQEMVVNMTDERVSFIWDKSFKSAVEKQQRDSIMADAALRWEKNVGN